MLNNKYTKSLYTFFVIIISWYILHYTVNPNIIPNPFDVLKNLVHIFYPTIFFNLIGSLYRLIISMLYTIIFGYIIGISLGLSKKIDKYLSPIIYALYPLPRIALLPVFMVLFGLGDKSKIILIVTISIFFIIITIRDAIVNLPKEYIISGKVLKLTKLQTFKHIIFPYSLPYLFTSMKIVLGSSIAALFFTESYGARYGIGYYIMDAWGRMNYIDMYTGIFTLCFLGGLVFKVIDYFYEKTRYNK